MPDLQNPETFRAILDSLQIGVYLVDRNRKILYWNDGAEQITGYHRHEVVGRSCKQNILMHCDEHGCVLCGTNCPVSEVIHQGKPMEAQVYLHHKGGHRVPVHVRAVPVRDDNGMVIGVAESFSEEPPQVSSESHEERLAACGCLDVTTGVPHHQFTQFHLRQQLAVFCEFRLPFGVMCIQIEQLQHVAETHGREAAKVMSHVVAQSMKHILGPAAFLGRWTEDRFLVILPDCNRAELEKIGENLQKIIGHSGIQWWDDYLEVTISRGTTMSLSEDTVESLVRRAEQGLDPADPVVGALHRAEK